MGLDEHEPNPLSELTSPKELWKLFFLQRGNRSSPETGDIILRILADLQRLGIGVWAYDFSIHQYYYNRELLRLLEFDRELMSTCRDVPFDLYMERKDLDDYLFGYYMGFKKLLDLPEPKRVGAQINITYPLRKRRRLLREETKIYNADIEDKPVFTVSLVFDVTDMQASSKVQCMLILPLAESIRIVPGNISAARPAFSERELDVIRLLDKGMPTKEIADRLHISRFTIDNHRKNISKKGVSIIEAINYAKAAGLI